MSVQRKSPIGNSASNAAAQRAKRSAGYHQARDEYAAQAKLREVNWIASHVRERRYELELTQHEVADRAGTSHSAISRLENGRQTPTLAVLQRILGVLDERLVIGVERDTLDGPEQETVSLPYIAA